MTTVDRRAVEEIIDKWLGPESYTGMRIRDELVGLAQLHSSNAQAVAWQWRNKSSRTWHGCTQGAYEARGADREGRLEYRALCVISDTPPGEK